MATHNTLATITRQCVPQDHSTLALDGNMLPWRGNMFPRHGNKLHRLRKMFPGAAGTLRQKYGNMFPDQRNTFPTHSRLKGKVTDLTIRHITNMQTAIEGYCNCIVFRNTHRTSDVTHYNIPPAHYWPSALVYLYQSYACIGKQLENGYDSLRSTGKFAELRCMFV